MSLATRLYSGETTIQFVARRRLWFTIAAVMMLISLVALVKPGLNLGIDFKGGSTFRVATTKPVTIAQVQEGLGPVAEVVQVTSDTPSQVIVTTKTLNDEAQVARIRSQLSELTGADANKISTQSVGAKWGSTVSRRALWALLAFLVVVTVYVSFRFEFKMAMAALLALLHDLLITAGIYAICRFEVSPATVVALLTILGYSLYDTVVVFDKVRENTGSITSTSRTTYSEQANRAVNQTVIRSLNTSLMTLLPVGALLLGGLFLPGGETLKDLALALFVGVAAGTYSSMFLATPLTAAWKEREPRYQQIRARVERQRAIGAAGEPVTPRRPASRRPAPGVATKATGATQSPQVTTERDGDRVGAIDINDLADRDDDLDGAADDQDGTAVPEPATTASRSRQGQTGKPRPGQPQRRKQGGSGSRPAKRRRR